jgi:outer membrane protein OmpA-like peptidoglycan-associated protein
VNFSSLLARRRAAWIRARLIGQGVAATAIFTSEHGERRLAIWTQDGIDDPRNRRVEITISQQPSRAASDD